MRFALITFGLMATLAACENEQATAAAAATEAAPVRAASPGPVTTPPGARAEDDPGQVMATWDGGQIIYEELRVELQGQVAQLEANYLQERYAVEQQAAEQMMLQRLLEEESAKARYASVDEFIEKEILASTAAPTDQEVADYYEVVKRKLRGAPLESVKADLVADLTRRKQMESLQAYATDLKVRRNAKVTVPYPDLPRIHVSVDDDPARGASNAAVTIVQFAEFQCPYCGKSKETVDKLLTDYDGKVRMVFRDFPLGFHDRAIPAAIAANCAGEQGRYWEMYDQMMANQSSLQESDLERYATAAGVDELDKWKKCRTDPKQEEEVRADMADGSAAGVNGTPAFFINGIMLSGAQPYEQFKVIIDSELARL